MCVVRIQICSGDNKHRVKIWCFSTPPFMSLMTAVRRVSKTIFITVCSSYDENADIVIGTGDKNAQVGRVSDPEQHLGDRLGVNTC